MPFIAFFVIIFGLFLPVDTMATPLKKAMGDNKNLTKIPKTLSPLEKKILTWYRMQLPATPFSAVELFAFIEKNPSWPALDILQRQAERKIGGELNAERIIALFDQYSPLSSEGYEAYIDALLKKGETEEALQQIKEAWHQNAFPKDHLKQFYEKYRDTLLDDDHLKRIEILALAGKKESLKHLAPYVSPALRGFIKGLLLMMDERPIFQKGIGMIPREFADHPLVYYFRFKSELAHNKIEAALTLFEGVQAHEIDKNHPKAWLPLRFKLARALREEGKYQKAYNVLTPHHLPFDAATSHVDWFAGWLAHHHLKNHLIAYERFKNMYRGVSTPISKSKALYWMGKALMDAGLKTEAESLFKECCAFQYTYYGQEAAKELGKKLKLPLKTFKLTEKKLTKEWREIGEVVKLLKQQKLNTLLKTFFFHIAKKVETEDECEYVTALAKECFPDQLVVVSKLVGRKHSATTLDAYPVLQELLKEKHDIDKKVILHALIRQESGFNARNTSPAGAQGLMQLMPATAKEVFRALFPHQKKKAHNLKDPKTNLLLGTHYFDRIMENFNNNLPVALAAYNAGPRRAKMWVESWGIPGEQGVSLNEWIENIPYEETRSYICRILEALPVYKNLILEKTKPLTKAIPRAQKKQGKGAVSMHIHTGIDRVKKQIDSRQ